MKIERIALYTTKIEAVKEFYSDFFDIKVGEKYFNIETSLKSYLLTFENGMKLELLQKPYMNVSRPPYCKGYTHISIKLGSKEKVDELTKRITDGGFSLKIKPRVTTDGQYASCVFDPDDNEIELVE